MVFLSNCSIISAQNKRPPLREAVCSPVRLRAPDARVESHGAGREHEYGQEVEEVHMVFVKRRRIAENGDCVK
jgi:hypothetical protein